MIYLIILGNLFAAAAVSFFLTKLIWAIPFIRKYHEIATYNEIIRKSSYDQIDEPPPLVDFTNLNDAYLFEAVKLLVKHEPSRAAAIVVTLEPQLSQLRKDMLGLGEDAQRAFREAAEDWAQHIMTVAPIPWITDLWHKASHERDQIWLFEYIFKNKVRPIVLHGEAPDGIFVECEREILFLKVSDKEYNTRDRIGKFLSFNNVLKWANNPNDQVNHHTIPTIDIIVGHKGVRSWTRIGEDIIHINHVPKQEDNDNILRQSFDDEIHIVEGQKTIGALIKQNAQVLVSEASSR